MKSAIVVGGAGFVGSAVVRELIARGVETWAVVRPGFTARGNNRRLEGLKVHILECDLRNIGSIAGALDGRPPEVWYQFAWDGLSGEALLDYAAQIMNIRYTMDAVAAAARAGCGRFIGAGSISQFELQAAEGRVGPGDKHQIYKAAKQACESMGSSVAERYGIEFLWPIITNIFGPGENSPRLVNTMIRNLLRGKRQPLSDGNQIYDFIYLTDAARAFALIGENGKPGRRYVVASGGARPLREFLCELRDVVAPDAELGFGEMPFNGFYLPKEDYDTGLLRLDTGFAPEVTFAQGVRKTADWIRLHPEANCR